MAANLESFDPATGASSSARADGVGAMLRNRRIELGLSQSDVANTVKLPPRRIEAMEAERWDELPDGPYLRGFLRNIARALSLDADTLMARVDESVVRSRDPHNILLPASGTRATLPRRSGPGERRGGRPLVAGAIGFALIAALIAWSGTDSFERAMGGGRKLVDSVTASAPASAPPAESVSEPVAVAASTESVPAPTAATTPADTPAAASPPPAVADATALRFQFKEESWVEVRSADGKVLLKRLNAAGSEQTVDGTGPFTLIVGNAKGVALEFRGQAVDLSPYTRDSVARLTLS